MQGKLSNQSVPICNVLIVDDHPAVREGLLMRINQQQDMRVSAEASGVQEALQLLGKRPADVAVIDISLKDGNGIDLIQRIKAARYQVRILVWSMHPDNLYAERALRAGALGYINKENTTGQLVEAIRSVSRDEPCFSPEITRQMLNNSLAKKGQETLAQRLSNRELDVFKMIGEGLKTSVIAQRLCISVHTVETHRQRIKTKLNLNSAAELTTRAARWMVEEC
ncbi:MAG: DNA-binding NarL/FixJ family response regulator [Motiliproteus sp.]|jgi:DNA-binding NarL/FixJ family response regulator